MAEVKRTTLDDVRQALGRPAGPVAVEQTQFDGNQAALERLAAGGSRVEDLQDYALDLRYVEPLQPDLFQLAFPECLRAWRATLLGEGGDEAFVQEFHAALAGSRTWEGMLDSAARHAVLDFLRDALQDALERQEDLRIRGARSPAHRWIAYHASFGTVSPDVDRLWAAWWAMPTPGAAVAAFQFASCLLYPAAGNPVFLPRKPRRGGGPPHLWSYESVGFEERWRPENVDFLRRTLTADFVADRLCAASERLRGHPAADAAERILSDLPARRATLDARVRELPVRLERPSSMDVSDWEA
jgi:hypothetical protein